MPATLTREQRRHALAPVRENWDRHDVWGSTMGSFFDLAEFMDAASIDIPWDFTIRTGHDLEDLTHAWQAVECDCDDCASGETYGPSQFVPFLDAGELGIEMLVYAGNVLDRMRTLVERAGKDY